jgi:putative DNA primase/helicase
MLAVLRYADGKGASIHRTFLGADGQKAAVDPVRMMMPGFSLEGAAVRLGPLQKRIGIAEGIETAICAGKLFGLPVWAAVSANGMRVWDVPLGVESVVVCGDHDLSFTGQAAAFELARKLKAKGLTVEVMIPPIPGMDWQDVWSEQNKSGA